VGIVFRDVTAEMAEREQLEKERRELSQVIEQARVAAHFRERFIGILGHDLRSPLTAISASAALLQRMPDLSAPAQVATARIASSADRMGRMIRDLLDFTQARLGGGLSVVRKPCDVAEVARAVVDEVHAAKPDRAIHLDLHGDVKGQFDPDRAAQLLSNLLNNALHYGPPGEEVEVELRPADDGVEIAVSNAGPAIPPEERASLFDPFRRGSAGSEHRGLGLGLFIVDQIARAHGGTVSVTSTRGRTRFEVALPLQR
jgi:signal transduction histidine kinase